MKAIILAAGKGERLRPLTDNIPKCMVELFGKTLLDRQIEIFRKFGISEIIVVTGYKSEKIKNNNVILMQNKLYDSTNMVETLFCARNALVDSVIISYGDIIFEEKVLEKLISSKNDSSVVVDKEWKKYWEKRFKNPLDDAESLKIDDDGNILEIGKKVSDIKNIQGQYIGLMKFNREGLKNLITVYDNLKEKNNEDGDNEQNTPFERIYMTDLLQEMINQGIELKAVPISNGWLELDSLNDYNLYQKKYKDETLTEIFSVK